MYVPIYEPITQEPKYALRLINEDDETVLCIVNAKTGEMVSRGRLIFLRNDGTFGFCPAVNAAAAAALGIKLDTTSHVIVR